MKKKASKKIYKKFSLSKDLPDSFKKKLLQGVWKWRWSSNTEVGYVKEK